MRINDTHGSDVSEMLMRTRVNLSIDETVVEEAKSAGINMSRVAEEAIAAAAKLERNRRWVEENREALEDYNRHVAEHGLPLEKYRTF
jgi:antitoxin CcdA